jgi:hypothetical protein
LRFAPLPLKQHPETPLKRLEKGAEKSDAIGRIAGQVAENNANFGPDKHKFSFQPFPQKLRPEPSSKRLEEGLEKK